MQTRHVDYDRIAPTYNQRFQEDRREATAEALLALARDLGARRVLEVGCGTGRWLAELNAEVPGVYGLDLSSGMLAQARSRKADLGLARGHGCFLPFPDATFDLVYCVNAIHHFSWPRLFISEARRLLKPGGRLAVVGMDPHNRRDSWYVYHYFPGVYETDLRRFPSWGTILDWMIEEGLEQVECRLVERIVDNKVGCAVLDDPFLQKHSCSQLALLTDQEYGAGVRLIQDALDQAEKRGESLVFPSVIEMGMLTGHVQTRKTKGSRR